MPSTATSILDGLSTSVAVKAPCRTVATSNITLAGLQTISGYATAENDRVLVKGQTNAVDNGIYLASTGNWTRSKDADGNRDLVQGTRVIVRSATIAGVEYELTTPNPIVVGTSTLAFERRYGANATYDQTDAEIAAGVVPVNDLLPEGHLLRYGNNTIPGTTDMAPAFTAAIALKMPIHVPLGVYRHDGQMAPIVEGGLIGEGWGSGNDTQKAQIVFYNITDSTSPAVRLQWSADNPGGLRFFENIDIRASSWDSVTGANGDGMDITGPSRVRNVLIGSFKRYGLFIHSTATNGQAPYDSLLENVKASFSGQHGIVHGTGANTVTYINCGARWNGAPSFGVAPSVAGNYDGFHMDSQNDGNPDDAFHFYTPEGVTIIGGDCSYNSRYGWNFIACQNGVMQPGYAEGNLQAAPGQVNLSNGLTNCFISLAAISGRATGVNFGMVNSGADLGSNRVFVGGRDCGAGNSNTDTSRTQMSLARAVSYIGHNNDFSSSTRISGDTAGVTNLSASGTGYWNLNGTALRYSGTQVLAGRRTGWTAATGTATRTTFDTASVTTAQLAERVKAIVDDLIAHGLIGS